MKVSQGTWEKYNELCKQSGIDVLIWDWYWYNNEPCLHEALENGFLRASNRNDVKFACMWTNHPWYVLYPTLLPNGYKAYPPSFAPADGSLKECWRVCPISFPDIVIWKIIGGLMTSLWYVFGTLIVWRRILGLTGLNSCLLN